MKIILYSMPLCQPCQQTKKFFRDNSIDFIDVDVKENTQAYDHMKKISGQQYVPVIDVDGELIIGFDEKKLLKLL